MTDEERLAAYQSELLKLLDQGSTAADLARGLKPVGWAFHETLDSLDPHAVETAVELVRTWAIASPKDD